jgi:hypothetical protein
MRNKISSGGSLNPYLFTLCFFHSLSYTKYILYIREKEIELGVIKLI